MNAAEFDLTQHFPRGVTDPLCPDEHVITESTERRLLRHVELVLSGSGGDQARDTSRALSQYLAATCTHHWHDYVDCCQPPKDGCIPAHSQCLWCNAVVWADEGSS